MPRRLLVSKVIIFGLILAILTESRAGHTPYDSDSDSDSHISGPEKDQFAAINEKNPAMHCLLFGHNGCLIDCYLTGHVYNTIAVGSCDTNQTCRCKLFVDGSLHNNWYSKFKTEYVLRQINLKSSFHNQIYDLVIYPLRTSEEIKQAIKPLISPYQYSILETRDSTLAATFVNANGQYDKDSVRKYVIGQFDLIAEHAPELYLNLQFKDKFREALRTASAATLYNFTHKVRELGNEVLYDILKKHLEERKIAEPEVDLYEPTSLEEILYNVVINEIIKRNEGPLGPLNELIKKNSAGGISS